MEHLTSRHHRRNQLHTVMLILGLTALLAVAGWLVGGFWFMICAIASVLFMAAIAPYASPTMVLRLHKAERLSAQEAPSLFALLNELSRAAGLADPPKLYYIPSSYMLAFTVGLQKNASIALSDGLLRRMNRREVNAILAHEISHIKNQDMRMMMLADAMNQLVRIYSVVGLLWLFFSLPLVMYADYVIPWLGIILLVILPSFTAKMKMSLSRTREYEADRTSAELTGDPYALISALSRMEYREWRWLGRLFRVQPQTTDDQTLKTHPDTDERIERLKIQAAEMGCESASFGLGLDRLLSRHVWELNKRNFMDFD